jgi:DHA3 family macrolide efflux protein-like MFS transporter
MLDTANERDGCTILAVFEVKKEIPADTPPMTTSPQPVPSGVKAVFALADFRKLWLGQFVSVFGDFLAIFGVVSLITFRWHGTASQVTYVLVAYMLPLGIVSPIAGVFVDRLHVKPVMITSDLTRGVLILALLRATTLWQVCTIFVVLAVISSFFQPAQSVTIRTIVPMDKLLAANAMMSQAFYVVRLLSPVAAGALVAWLGEKSCFYLDSFSFFFSAAMIATIHVVRQPAPANKTLKGFFEDLMSGNRFIFTHHSLAFVITSMVAGMFVMSCLSPLFSIYVRDILGRQGGQGTLLYGVISSAVGVGLILGTTFITRFAKTHSKKAIVVSGLFICGAGVALLGLFKYALAAVGTTFTMGFGIAFIVVAAQTLMQQETPREMLGRVSSSFMSVFSFAQVFGLLLSGQLAVWLGIRQVFLACSAALVLISAFGYQRHKSSARAAAAPATD